jgi:hypothetical protein
MCYSLLKRVYLIQNAFYPAGEGDHVYPVIFARVPAAAQTKDQSVSSKLG